MATARIEILRNTKALQAEKATILEQRQKLHTDFATTLREINHALKDVRAGIAALDPVADKLAISILTKAESKYEQDKAVLLETRDKIKDADLGNRISRINTSLAALQQSLNKLP